MLLKGNHQETAKYTVRV